MAESLGLGSKFERNNGTTWQTIAQVASIQPPQPEREVVEIDELNPPDMVRRKLPGLIDLGEVTVMLNFDPDDGGHTALESDFYAGTKRPYRIVLPSNDGWTFEAYIVGFTPQELSVSDVIQVEATFAVVTKPTFGPIV